MYIRRTKTKTAEHGEDSYTYRIVESVREGTQVKQRKLLNLGKDFAIGCDHNLKQPQQKERQRDLFFAKTESIVEPLKLMPVNLKCQQHPVVSSAYRQDKISVL